MVPFLAVVNAEQKMNTTNALSMVFLNVIGMGNLAMGSVQMGTCYVPTNVFKKDWSFTIKNVMVNANTSQSHVM